MVGGDGGGGAGERGCRDQLFAGASVESGQVRAEGAAIYGGRFAGGGESVWRS